MKGGRGWTCATRKDFYRDGVSKAMYSARLLATSLLREGSCSFIAAVATSPLKRFCCSGAQKIRHPSRLRGLQEPTPRPVRSEN